MDTQHDKSHPNKNIEMASVKLKAELFDARIDAYKTVEDVNKIEVIENVKNGDLAWDQQEFDC